MTDKYDVFRNGDAVTLRRTTKGIPIPKTWDISLDDARAISFALYDYSKSPSTRHRTLTIGAGFDDVFSFNGSAMEAEKLAKQIDRARREKAA